MIKGISAAALSICVGAFASSGPEATAPAATASSETTNAVASGNPASPSQDGIHEPDEAGAPERASASSENESDQLVCRREKEPGSNFSRKVCYTQAQIDARAEKDKDAVHRMRAIGKYAGSEPGGG